MVVALLMGSMRYINSRRTWARLERRNCERYACDEGLRRMWMRRRPVADDALSNTPIVHAAGAALVWPPDMSWLFADIHRLWRGRIDHLRPGGPT